MYCIHMNIKNFTNPELMNNPQNKKQAIKIFIITLAFILSLFALIYLFSMKTTDNNQTKVYKGEYVTYSSNALDDIKGKNTVLFFYDDESVKSRVIDATFKDGGDKPDNIKIIKVDMYDNENLKEKYKIEESNTMIKVDENGNEIKRSTQPTNIQEIAEFAK